ncbi:MAG: twin-arginine translocase subunit TatC [Nitrososphaeria archaeon]
MEQAQLKEAEKPLLSHINELLHRMRTVLIVLAVAFFVFFAFGITTVKVAGYLVPMPYPSIYHSISDNAIKLFIYSELPSGLKLININPFDPLFASFYVSFYLSLFIAVPVIVREIWGFVAPGLYRHERNLLRYVIAPAFGLFVAGSAFAYFVIIPFMMRFILLYTQVLGVEPTLSLRAFINTVISLMMVTGIAFEYPLVMSMLTYLKAVAAKTWKKSWKWGILGAFVIAWMISPGTTGGVIETIIGLILTGLYFVGVAASYTIEKRRYRK